MTEFVSKVNRDEYEIIFKTDKVADYREIQEAIRKIIDRNMTQILSRYMDIYIYMCVCCSAEIPEGQQICNACERSAYGKDL